MSTQTQPLSDADLQHFEERGYLVLREAAPADHVERTVEAIYAFLGIGRQVDERWYQDPVHVSGTVEMFQHPALWANRQHPKIHAAFSQLWRTEKLWVSIDRASFKPPAHPDHPEFERAGFLHLDADPWSGPVPFGLQGVLYLVDTTAEQGGFHCLPGWHQRTDAWLELLGDRKAIKGDELAEVEGLTPIEAKAGDLVIWHKALPHGNGQNHSDRPRIAQYITMYPAAEDNDFRRGDRVCWWRRREAPPYQWVRGDPRHWEREHGETAELSALGRRLLGLDRWA